MPILAALLVLALLGIVAALALGGSDDDEKTAASADGGAFDGTVYLMAHEQAPGQNAVYAYQYGDGRVSPVRLRQYPTGGTGAIDVTDTTFVDADQQVWTDEDKGFLFVTNQGSDTVAVFRIADDGALTPVPGSPFPSRGTAPVSVGVSGNTVAVAHKAVDGVRDLKGKRPSLTTFRLEDDGRLTPTGRPLEMGEGQTPTQAWVTRNGKQAIVSDLLKGNYFTFELRDDNTARQASVELVNDEQRAQGIPLTGPPPPVASGQRGGPPPPKPQDGGGPPARADGGGQGGGGQGGDGPPDGGGQGGPPPDGGDGGAPAPMGPLGAQGLVGHPKEPILYSTFSGESALAVHEYDERGTLKFVRGVPVRGGFLICWTDVSPDGRFLYAGITYSNSIAVFDLKDPRNPRPIQLVRMRGPGNAVNVRVEPEGGTLFAVSGRFTTVDPGGTGNFLHTLDIGPDGRVKEQPTSPVQVPVGMDGQAVGLAVVPRR